MRIINRKHFLKTLGLAGVTVAVAPIFNSCSKDNTGTNISGGENPPEGGNIGGGNGGSSGSGTASTYSQNSTSTGCVTTASETAGPFPIKNPSSLVRTDIIGDRKGISLSIEILIQNLNNSCNALSNVFVDIWHCDKDGYYSEYGGTRMQSVNYTNNHFLRGRQKTNSNGKVYFTSIFPGWYQSRATHIHIHIYKTDGTSLLVTQIAFPEDNDSAVVAVNASSENGYTKGMNGYTYNNADNVFSDGSVENQLCKITGSIADGYKLVHTIKVAS